MRMIGIIDCLPLSCHDVVVGDWVGDGNVSVHGDDDQVENAGGARPHVHGKPDEAEVASEDPCVQHLIDSGQGEDEEAEQEVSQGQGDDDGVGGAGQLAGDLDCCYHKDVSKGYNQTNQTQGNQ